MNILEVSNYANNNPFQKQHVESMVKQAINDGLALQIKYERYPGAVSDRIISNISYSDDFGSGYISAYCHLRQAQRTFLITRIKDAKIVSTIPEKLLEDSTPYHFDSSKQVFGLYGEKYE